MKSVVSSERTVVKSVVSSDRAVVKSVVSSERAVVKSVVSSDRAVVKIQFHLRLRRVLGKLEFSANTSTRDSVCKLSAH